MKITLRDFGPISHFEFDLEKDLHVIFGKNNIGKSYAITAVYLILKHLITESDQNIKSLVINDAEKEILTKINGNRNDYVEVNKIIENAFQGFIVMTLGQKLRQSFNNSFASINRLSNKRSKAKFSIDLQQKNFSTTLCCDETPNVLLVKNTKVTSPVLIKRNTDSILSLEEIFTLSFENENKGFSQISECLNYLFDNLISKELLLINKVYFLPASRSGLYQTLNSFSPIIAELSKSRNLLTQKIELPSISEPVADYFLNLSNIDNKANTDFDEIINIIEKNILKGTISFNDETKKIIFKEDEIDEEMELSYTSSMVSEIAPIVAYLKYIITNEGLKNDSHGLLFIEEPEAHLHPEVQVKLMEMFALLAGKNVKIVMTSHSNYMFNKLSNLVLEGKIEYTKVGSYLMRATDAGSVTDTLSMKAEADGMNDENFADVAEMLYEERIRIYEKLNKEAENVD